MRILFIIPYPLHEAPSQRFRFEQYFTLLKERGYTVRTQSFFSAHQWRIFYRSGHTGAKILALASGFAKRFYSLLIATRYDFVFIHREAAPVGPPIFEWLLAKVFRKKIIYDFDDAIWMTDKLNESVLERTLRWRSKVASICKWAYRVSCGNEYLCAYALKYNPQVVYNPTTIDTEQVHNKSLFPQGSEFDRIVIGWTGSHSTLKYLEELVPVFRQIINAFPKVSVLVIADRPPSFEIPNLIFRKWSEQTEISDLLRSHIGVMPLPDDPWANGKCGFKALQYMALEIPTIASPVGVNTRIVLPGKAGFLASSQEEWLQHLHQLIAQPDLRKSLGLAGRKKVVDEYSVVANTDNFIGLFK